jgi:hypothetical protein
VWVMYRLMTRRIHLALASDFSSSSVAIWLELIYRHECCAIKMCKRLSLLACILGSSYKRQLARESNDSSKKTVRNRAIICPITPTTPSSPYAKSRTTIFSNFFLELIFFERLLAVQKSY